MQNPDEQEPALPGRERGSSGLGTLLGVGGFLAAGLAAAAFFEFAPLAIVAGGGLALMGAAMMVLQNHKQVKNDTHAERAYHLTEGYHHEPEVVKDQSLLHAIKGPSDLPQRRQYIKDNYGVTPLSADQYSGGRLGMTAIIGLGVGGLITAAVATLGAPILGAGALAYGLMLGAMGGATAAGVHQAKTMQKYGSYLDNMEAAERAKADQKPKKREPVEYDNQRTRPGSYAVDVAASRSRVTTSVTR